MKQSKIWNNIIRIVLLVAPLFLFGTSFIQVNTMFSLIMSFLAIWGGLACYLVLLLLGKARGLTDGIGGLLFVFSLVWHIVVSLNGYEDALLPVWITIIIPLLMFLGGLTYLILDIILRWQRTAITEKVSLRDNIIVAVTMIVALYPIIHLSRWTLPYVDQGQAIPYFTGKFLFSSIAIILLIGLAVYTLITTIRSKRGIGSVTGSMLAILSSLTFAFGYFFMPTLFWTGIQQVALLVAVISIVVTTPPSKRVRFATTAKAQG
ncbi:hypothetical protein LACPH_002112 [Lacticaseibacillus parahuelsenbergensis]|uniref:Uncharacterized protein n=1 Tax=Lacticaseibacillus parahuelsenbergensis TaxID=3068305 RepID=A0ABY9L0W3_9LACO|nr:hypothetical protein [Lacticaseibacillus sp. NCIMB 15471]WLV77368.1 hypothetical protein LACPH_002112 [Lacticaseibacillus sp. NCIMB 15471]